MPDKVETRPEDLDPKEAEQLEDGDLDAVAGGRAIAPADEPNNNCGNTQCCG